MIEDVVVDKVVDFAKKNGWLARAMAYRGRRGCRDYDFYRGGRTVMIEFKRPGKEPEPHQERERRRLRDHGIIVHVIDNIADGCALLV